MTHAIETAALHLEDVLLAERDFLLSGQVRAAASLVEDKIAALEAFEGAAAAFGAVGAPAAVRALIVRVVQMAEENAVHLEAVRNGLGSLIGRVSGAGQDAYAGVYRQGGGQMAFPQATGQYRKWV